MSFKMLEEYLFCSLCNQERQLCKVSWLHTWKRCFYCLLKLPRLTKKEKCSGGES